MTLTAAGKAHMDAMKAGNDARLEQAQADRVADDIEHLAFGDIVFTNIQRDGNPWAGCVVRVDWNRDEDPPTVTAVKFVGFIADEPCDVCGGPNTRRTQTKVLLVPPDDITEIRPRTATGMHGWWSRLCRLAATEGPTVRGQAYWEWAGILAEQAGIRANSAHKPRGHR